MSSSTKVNNAPHNPLSDEKYKFQSLSFPLDLGAADKSHYMLFYINETNNSKYVLGKGTSTEKYDDQASKEGQGTSSKSSNKAHNESIVNSNNIKALKNTLTLNAGTTRSKSAIALYMPQSIVTSYSLDYESSDLHGSGIYKVGKDVVTNISSGNKEQALSSLIDGAIDILKFKGLGFLPQSIKELGLNLNRQAINPHKEQLFRGTGFRSFTWSWKLFPKTEAETEVVANIIREFKFHSMPQITGGAESFFLYPSDFNIFFYSGTEENPWINKVTTCALTNMEVNYTPAGVWSTFRNNFPVEVDLSLTFTELEIMSKKRIQQGY